MTVRCLSFFMAGYNILHDDAINSLADLQLRCYPVGYWHQDGSGHFDRTTAVQSHLAYTSFIRLEGASQGRTEPGFGFNEWCNVVYSFGACYLMMFFSMFFAVCVGQASNPGPATESFKLVIANPTALNKKVSRLLKMNADVIVTSETSATSVIQKEITHEMMKCNFRSFWSPPVAPKKHTLDNRPSYRGEALGTAIFSRHPSRVTRVTASTALCESQRFCSCVVRFGTIEI